MEYWAAPLTSLRELVAFRLDRCKPEADMLPTEDAFGSSLSKVVMDLLFIDLHFRVLCHCGAIRIEVDCCFDVLY